jgi:predicted phosphodiesterase
MRYLVFGDVHGNLMALDAVLEAGRARGIDGYFFLGDVVGYGPNPIECIDRLLALKQQGLLAWVLGNHELAVRGEADLSAYSAEAVATLRWTKRMLDAQPWAMNFVRDGSLILHVNDRVYLTHDSILNPGSGNYHRLAREAVNELQALIGKGGRIGFYGHTHTLRADFLDDENVLLVPMQAHEGDGLDPNPLAVQDNQVGWIGVGSVGFPTNKQRKPEYLIFDDEDWHIEKYALTYARDQARAKARETLLPECGQAVAERVAHWL